jgi:hypothetical protein
VASTADVVGGTLPLNWKPSGGVDALDAAALAAVYAAGPQDLSPVLPHWTGISVNAPATYWISAGGGLFRLTGLGSALAPKSYINPGPGS